MNFRILLSALICALGSVQPACAQHSHEDMPGMQQTAAPPSTSLIDQILEHAGPGTAVEPNSSGHMAIMLTRGPWMLMFHGVAFLNELQESGPRGADKVFSTNWFMGMAQRTAGKGQITFKLMLSAEPATVTHRFYPELFQQGETAFGNPITDGQHPHDFVMEMAALYDLKLGRNTLLSFYAAPVGDPAMGPEAYAHRRSASEDPIAPLGHHFQDSTHIANDVVTAGLTYRAVRLEASGFHGREPDEFRWDINSGRIDSWSGRLTVQPGSNWSAQYSFAHLTAPEALHPDEDLDRMTASLMYNRPLVHGNWASTLLWGRNHSRESRDNLNSYLAESTLQFAQSNYVWGRIENADRTNELLLHGGPEPPGFNESFLARIQAYSAGYDHEWRPVSSLAVAVGGQVTFYDKPAFLTPIYGDHPIGVLLFARARIGQEHTGHGSHH